MTEVDQADGGDVWGPLHRDTEALDATLEEASAALQKAGAAALWRTEKDYPIGSALSDVLGALSTVVDGLMDMREEQHDADKVAANYPNVLEATSAILRDLNPLLSDEEIKHVATHIIATTTSEEAWKK